MTNHIRMASWLFVLTFAASPALAQPKDVVKLKMELLDTARKTYELENRYDKVRGYPDPERLYRWSRRWLEAQIDLAEMKEERTAAYKQHFDRMDNLATVLKARNEVGGARPEQASASVYYRTQAALWLDRAKNP